MAFLQWLTDNFSIDLIQYEQYNFPLFEADPFLARYHIEGTIPAGITIEDKYGYLTGSPTTLGAYPIRIVRTTINGEITYLNLVLNVIQSLSLPSIITSRINPITLNKDYSFQLQAEGGTIPYMWTTVEGSLPTGIALHSDGLIAGKTQKTGIFPIKIRVTDANKIQDTHSYTIVILTPSVKFRPRLISTQSTPVIVKDNFHQTYLYDYILTSLKFKV